MLLRKAVTLNVPDVSEFQGSINWDLLGRAAPVVIIRAHNGWRADYKWAANLAGSRKSTTARFFYQYLPASIDPAAAARAFKALVGPLQYGEGYILDLEEGAGDQRGRMQAWIDAIADTHEWVYSGLYFSRSHLPGVAIDWLAAYQGNEPTDAHRLWQNTDARRYPGITNPCDSSVFHGTVQDLITAMHWPTTPIKQEDDEMTYIAKNLSGADQWQVQGNSKVHIPDIPTLANLQRQYPSVGTSSAFLSSLPTVTASGKMLTSSADAEELQQSMASFEREWARLPEPERRRLESHHMLSASVDEDGMRAILAGQVVDTKSVQWNKAFWLDLAEQVGSVAGIAAIDALVVDLGNIDVWWSAAIVPALLSLKSWLARYASGVNTPSFVGRTIHRLRGLL
jgi:hypothetical protein